MMRWQGRDSFTRPIKRMMKTKILFSDLDDTLLDYDKNVSAEDLDSINEMIKAGHRFVLATGRPVYSAKVVAKRLDLYRDGIFLVTSNGGAIYDCGKEVTCSIQAKTALCKGCVG